MSKRDPMRKRSSIVPRAVFATAVVAVVPACARNAVQTSNSAAQPVANVANTASDAGGTIVDAGGDAAAHPSTRTIDVLTGDASLDVVVRTGESDGGAIREAASPRNAAQTVTADAGNTTIDAGPARRRARPVPVAHPAPPIDRHRFYGVARSTFENDPRNRPTVE